MLQSGNEKACIDVAILAEGYTEKEMDVFYQDAQRTCESLFSYEPFRSMKSKRYQNENELLFASTGFREEH